MTHKNLIEKKQYKTIGGDVLEYRFKIGKDLVFWLRENGVVINHIRFSPKVFDKNIGPRLV